LFQRIIIHTNNIATVNRFGVQENGDETSTLPRVPEIKRLPFNTVHPLNPPHPQNAHLKEFLENHRSKKKLRNMH
jgi:hypothetical protein